MMRKNSDVDIHRTSASSLLSSANDSLRTDSYTQQQHNLYTQLAAQQLLWMNAIASRGFNYYYYVNIAAGSYKSHFFRWNFFGIFRIFSGRARRTRFGAVLACFPYPGRLLCSIQNAQLLRHYSARQFWRSFGCRSFFVFWQQNFLCIHHTNNSDNTNDRQTDRQTDWRQCLGRPPYTNTNKTVS